jgi:hypothetical protein
VRRTSANGDRTRRWEEREARLRELDHRDLLRRIEAEAVSTAAAIGEATETQPDATLAWNGRTVSVSGFATHLRSQKALRRWDLVGDDDVSTELLAQHELLSHAVKFIGLPLLGRGLSAGAASEPFVAWMRCAGREDLIMKAADGRAHVSIGPVTGVRPSRAIPAPVCSCCGAANPCRFAGWQ